MITNTQTRLAAIASAIVVIAASAPSTLDAQAPRPHPASDPAAVAIHERYVKAVGTAALPEYSHWIQEMTIAGGVAIRTEISMAKPDRIHVRNSMGGQLMLEFGFDGTNGWSNSPTTGVVPISGPELEVMRSGVTGIMNSPVDSTARLVATGRSTLEDEPVDRVLAISLAGDTVEVFYAVATGLIAGVRVPAKPGVTPDISLMLLRDYKPFGGRMTPTTMVMRMAGMEAVSRTIQMDTDPIPAERFRKP